MSDDQRTILIDLLHAQGLRSKDYALFFGSAEGIFHHTEGPEGTEDFEEMSGLVLTRDNRVFDYWVGWVDGKPGFTAWEELPISPSWENASEYRRARAKLGI